MQFKIRTMQPGNIQQVQRVAKISWNATYDGIIPVDVQERFLENAYSDDMMSRRMQNSVMLVAEQEGRMVGFANFSRVNEAGESELAAIYLLPDAQGQGIGTALFLKGINILDDAKMIVLTVEAANKIGKTFYEAKGFDVIDEFEEDFDGHKLQSIRMRYTV
ncbi:GNAT family N-acetyltransferase [Sporosarcina gallistercoris]|uniref:GNAT family N-acetyltransferase n=1 Tax=Sporosarcina gallistercoris TaxID=2762245 RepID=A0ABR8PJS8_9BACL|nr:GNAT family N-acetyltransferase [Sporosarcina gallistercoris]MBD7908427.1 GNAT family N-acetyltransferase [Sporosarcina gallistercoris]